MRAGRWSGPRYADRALPAGPQHWAWNGKVAGGAYATPGTYRIVVAATNGTQRAAQSTSVLADAFRLEASVADAVRGHAVRRDRAQHRAAVDVAGRRRPRGGRRVLDGRDDEGPGRDVDGDHHPEAGRRPRGRSGSPSRPGTRPAAGTRAPCGSGSSRHPTADAALAGSCRRGDNRGVDLLPAWRSPGGPGDDDANGPRARLATALAGFPPAACERRRIARSLERGDHPPRGKPFERHTRRLSSAVRATRPRSPDETGPVLRPAPERSDGPSSDGWRPWCVWASWGRVDSPPMDDETPTRTSGPRRRRRPRTCAGCTPRRARPGTRPPSGTRAGSTRRSS